jgi:TPR repeat protein
MLWLHRAAGQGNSNAMAFIGTCYIRGEDGLKADHEEAVRWLRKASDLGNPAAMYSLGMVLEHDSGTPADKTEAMRWFLKSAQLGLVEAMTMAGVQYVSGINGQGPNYVAAIRWLRPAADKGDATAMFMIADLYRYGLGVPTDYAEAMRWSLKSAEGGNVGAMKLIGEMYEKGLGVPEDKVESRRWFQMAAKQGGN